MQPSRVGRAPAAVCANAVPAGIIDSSSGSASVTPMPWRNVRRDRCFFVMNDIASVSSLNGSDDPSVRILRAPLHALLERIALDDAEHERGEAVSLAPGA